MPADVIRNLKIENAISGKVIDVFEVDAYILAQELLDEYKDEVGIPMQFDGRLTRKRTRQDLPPQQTLRQAGVQDGETLIADIDYQAGADTSNGIDADERRRWNDYYRLGRFRSDVVTWSVQDFDPTGPWAPAIYVVHYGLRSLVGWDDNNPIFHKGFDVRIDLRPPFPDYKAKARYLGKWPWHPNVDPEEGRICYEDRWIPSIGIKLDKIVELIGQITAYQIVGLQKPIRRDEPFQAKYRSARERGLFPVDKSQIRLPDPETKTKFGARS